MHVSSIEQYCYCIKRTHRSLHTLVQHAIPSQTHTPGGRSTSRLSNSVAALELRFRWKPLSRSSAAVLTSAHIWIAAAAYMHVLSYHCPSVDPKPLTHAHSQSWMGLSIVHVLCIPCASQKPSKWTLWQIFMWGTAPRLPGCETCACLLFLLPLLLQLYGYGSINHVDIHACTEFDFNYSLQCSATVCVSKWP